MSLHRRHARRDLVEPDIVQALERCGWSVDRISAAGVPDLLIAHRSFGIRLAECKSETGTLTPAQREWLKRWRGPEPLVLRSVPDVERLMRTGVCR